MDALFLPKIELLMACGRTFPVRSFVDNARFYHIGGNARGVEVAIGGHDRRTRTGRSRGALTVSPFFRAVGYRRAKVASLHRTKSLITVEKAKALEKREMQADILEKYCGSRSYVPMIPPKAKKLIKRPRLERDMVNTRTKHMNHDQGKCACRSNLT